MATATICSPVVREDPTLPAEYLEPRWYAAYTCANHEKRVAQHLERSSVEYFLPLYKSLRRWKDRTVQLQLPLFPNYVFVRLALRDRLQILQIPSVVRLVGFNHPTSLPNDEIEDLRCGLERQLRMEPHPYLTIGRRVRIRSGPFRRWEGVLLRKRGKFRVVISLGLIMRSVVVDIDATDVLPMAYPKIAAAD